MKPPICVSTPQRREVRCNRLLRDVAINTGTATATIYLDPQFD